MSPIPPPVPPVAPRTTHYPDDPNPRRSWDWEPLCGATLEDSPTDSLRISPDFADCIICLDMRGGS